MDINIQERALPTLSVAESTAKGFAFRFVQGESKQDGTNAQVKDKIDQYLVFLMNAIPW